MISRELISKIKRIDIITRKLVNDVFAGEYHSAFKGHGIEFFEVREYVPGDDVRTIDWNVSARMGNLYVKKYIEERELTVMLMIDASASTRFGSVNVLKYDRAVEVASLFAFSAIKNNDKVGLIIFTDKVEKFIPPKKGRSHILRLIRELVAFQSRGTGTDINHSLEFLNRVLKKSAIVFLISDFLTQKEYKKAITIAGRRHDLVPVMIIDLREFEISPGRFIFLEDAETGEELVVELNRENVQILNKKLKEEIEKQKKFFSSINLDYIEIFTHKPYIHSLIKFFKERMRRI